MRFAVLFILLLAIGCNRGSVTQPDSTTPVDTNTLSLSNNYYHDSAVINVTNAPGWLVDFVNGQTDTTGYSYRGSVSRQAVSLDIFRQIGPGVSVAVYCVNEDEICLSTYLATFEGKSLKDSYRLSHQCDSELSNPNYRWSELFSEDNNTFTILQAREHPKYDSVLVDPKTFKDGIDLSVTETVIDSAFYKVTVLPSGEITGKRNQE